MKIAIKIFFFFSLCFFIFALCFKAYSIPAVSRAITLATTVQKESFTELYFEDHFILPAKVNANSVHAFKFTIHNLENQNITYPYEVYADLGNGGKLSIEKNKVSLKNNEFKTIEEKFIALDPFKKIKITVILTNKNQQINFWMEGENK